MKFGEQHRLVVDRDKIVDYLLNPTHPDNGGKAAFFEALGFRRGEWDQLAAALRLSAANAEAVQSMESPHGWKHVMIGALESPSGKSAQVRTVWIVDAGMQTTRLVTAYPAKAGKVA